MMNFLKKRDVTEKIILNLIRTHQPVTRNRLHQMTGIRIATISETTRDMVKDRIIFEGGEADISGSPAAGAKKKELFFNKDLCQAAGIDIQPGRIVFIATNLAGEIVAEDSRTFAPDCSKGDIIEKLLDVTGKYQNGHTTGKLLGVGISCPASLNKDRSEIVLSSGIRQLDNTPLKQIMEEKTKLPVMMDSSNNLYLLAEKWLGCAKKIDDVLCVQLDNGIGSGIISGGRLVRGHVGIEGELGHVVVEPLGNICACGNRGCLETVASLKEIKAQVVRMLDQGVYSSIAEAIRGDSSALTMEVISAAAEMGDKLANTVIGNAAGYIGRSVAVVVNVIGPQTVILGGEMTKNSKYFLESVEKSIRANVILGIEQNLEIKISSIPSHNGALGAAVLILDDFFGNQ